MFAIGIIAIVGGGLMPPVPWIHLWLKQPVAVNAIVIIAPPQSLDAGLPNNVISSGTCTRQDSGYENFTPYPVP